ncbi:STN and carboxypeptidase regulatory-like domain-containing protein [Flavitalea antarctica]
MLVLLTTLLSAPASGQSNLNKTIALTVSKQPVDQVLEILSNKGDFYFSYNSNIVPRDTLITLSENNKTVKQILEMIFKAGFEFRESGNYIIIRRTPIKLTLVTTKAVSENKIYTVSGYIVDDQTGEKVSYASIYEKERLASAMSNEEGYFKIKLKSRYKTASLTVSKEFYEDTTVIIEPRFNQQITITIMPVEITEQSVIISPKNYEAPDSIVIAVRTNDSIQWLYTYKKADSVRVEKTKVGDWLISSKLKFQTINLSRFFTARPYQVSIAPGLSTNGKLNSQVINNVSFNVFGGYSGGVNGFELGGLFNINKKDVRYVQVAGIFNVGGGDMDGVQVAGIHNSAMGFGNGLQVAGINNMIGRSFTGLQISGIYNHAGGRLNGMQVSGIANYSNKTMRGMQLTSIANITPAETKGVQVSAVFNYTRKLTGLQVGLINVCDTSEGYSLGLINIVRTGYHKLVFSSNDVITANFAFKTGNRKLYSILLGGMNTDNKQLIYSFGYGLGTERYIGKWFSISPEITSQYLYLGSWEHLNLLNKANLNLNVRFGKHFSIFAGPAFNVYYSNQPSSVPDFKFEVGPSKTYKYGEYVTGWFGWNAGISLF